jgi:hypothetical protein
MGGQALVPSFTVPVLCFSYHSKRNSAEPVSWEFLSGINNRLKKSMANKLISIEYPIKRILISF